MRMWDPGGTRGELRRPGGDRGNAQPTREASARGLAGVGTSIYRVRETPLQRTREAGVCKSPHAQQAGSRTARSRSDPNHQPRAGVAVYL